MQLRLRMSQSDYKHTATQLGRECHHITRNARPRLPPGDAAELTA